MALAPSQAAARVLLPLQRWSNRATAVRRNNAAANIQVWGLGWDCGWGWGWGWAGWGRVDWGWDGTAWVEMGCCEMRSDEMGWAGVG